MTEQPPSRSASASRADAADNRPTGGDGLAQETAMRLVLAQESLLVGFVRAIVGSRTVAEDVFQDLVVLVMRKYAEIPNAEAVPGWTRRAARFLALKALEKRARERPTMDSDLMELLEQTWVNEVSEPVDALYMEALEHCRAQLSDSARDLLHYRYVQDLSGEEIAEKTHRPLNTIYVTLSRVQRSLAACIRAQVRGRHV